jgi:hypothetical protein
VTNSQIYSASIWGKSHPRGIFGWGIIGTFADRPACELSWTWQFIGFPAEANDLSQRKSQQTVANFPKK